MPEYTYRCESCENICSVRHSIKERLEDCEECKTTGSLIRIPCVPLILKKKNNSDTIGKPGKVVERFISNAKQDLQEEKENLSNKEY